MTSFSSQDLKTAMALKMRAKSLGLELTTRQRRDKWPPHHVVGPESNPVPFHLGQQWTWDAQERFVAMLAGTQSGKTVLGPWWLLREISTMGPGDYLAVTATYDLFKMRMLPAMLQVFRDLLGIGRWWAGDRIIEIKPSQKAPWRAKKSTDPMWGRIILRSADSAGGLEAGTCKAAWADECGQDRFRLDSWRAVRRRLAIHEGRALLTTTLYNVGWIKSLFIDPVKKSLSKNTRLVELEHGAECEENVAGDTCLIQYDSIINPTYPIAEYLAAKASVPEDEFELYWRGRAARLRTLIYNFFNPDVNVVPSFKPPMEWPRFVGVDPKGAYVAAVWLAWDPDKEQLHVYREYKEPFGPSTREHAEAMMRESRQERIWAWCGGGPSERQERTDFAEAGIPLKAPPITEVWAGVRRTNSLFKEFGLVVHEDCPQLIDELGSYKRKRNQAGEMTDKIKDKDTFHLCDALRYGIAHLTGPRHEEEVIDLTEQLGRIRF